MASVRADICYRPLRIGWAIRENDFSAFRQAVKFSYALWGGRFNPIIVVDHEAEAQQLVDLFRVDFLFPIGDSEELKQFQAGFPYLHRPFLGGSIFSRSPSDRPYVQVLDIQNALMHVRENPDWQSLRERGIKFYTWDNDDPLADVFLIQFGQYPPPDEVGTNYKDMLTQAANATESIIDAQLPIAPEALDHFSISSISRYGLRRHYSVEPGWSHPGFFVGDATKLDDLVCCWNLRAADIPVWFIDSNHNWRYVEIIPKYASIVSKMLPQRRAKRPPSIAVWVSLEEDVEKTRELLGEIRLGLHRVSDDTWNGLNVRCPMMYLGETSTLGLIEDEGGRLKAAFPLSGKPFCEDVSFHTQRLVASVQLFPRLYGDDKNTLSPPYLPELNEFFGRRMYFRRDAVRIEPGRVGLVIHACDKDSFLYACPVDELIAHIFRLAEFKSELSPGGLVLRQLIGRLGGLQGGRVLKIPGVRRLLKTHGPMATFTKRSALQLIGNKEPENPLANFSDHKDLFIGPRPVETSLEAGDVFSYLVEKGLFRMGVELMCPSCSMPSWIPVDGLKQRALCELCGHEYNATRQLVKEQWYYRRSGVLGPEKNAQGAVPVALALQQLDANFDSSTGHSLYSPSLSLTPLGNGDLPCCEVDFIWMSDSSYTRKTAIILGECKDRGGLMDDSDVQNLRRIADAFPRKRFESFVLFAKLSAFTQQEIDRAKALNDEYRQRVILLTDRELEPYHIYERREGKVDGQFYAGGPEDLASATAKMYFSDHQGTS